MKAVQTQELIQSFCQKKPYVDSLVYVEDTDSFLLYDEEKKYYPPLPRQEMRRILFDFVCSSTKNFSRGLMSDMEEGIKYRCYRTIPRLSKTYIAINDGLINLNTLEVEPINKSKIAYHYIDCTRNDLHMDIPEWHQYINSVLVDIEGKPDQELLTVIEEMLGFYLIEEMKPEAAFFLYGKGSNGKSKLLELLENMLGSQYTKYRSLESITGYQFAAVDLLGNKLNIIRDEESKYIKADRLKTLVSGEAVTADRKNQDSVDFIPWVKIICSTNRIPTFSGMDYGLKRRLHFIPFRRKFSPEEMDHQIGEKLRKELPGILWQVAVNGARRLRENNYVFSKSQQMDDMMREFEEDVSSAIEFIRENFINDADGFIVNEQLYAEYDIWCRGNGRKTMSSKNFFKDINDICESIVTYSVEHGTNKRGRRLRAIGK